MAQIKTIADLTPDPQNARRHNPRNVGMLERSLNEVGAARSIVIDEDGVILAGNATIEAAAQAGIERVQVVEADGDTIIAVRRTGLTAEQKTKLALYDNRVAELAEWEPGVLASIAEDMDLSSLFTDVEFADLAQPTQGLQDDPPVTVNEDEETRCQIGQVWKVGRHTVACLDSTDRANVERLIAGLEIGMVVADPPYGIDIVAADVPIGGGEKYDYPFGGVGAAARRRHSLDEGGQRHKDKTGKYYIQERRLGTVGGSKPFGSRGGRDHVVAANSTGDNMIPAGRYAPVIGDDSPETAIEAVILALDLLPDATHFWWGANNYAHALPPSTCWIVWDKQNTGNFADAELAWSNHKSAVRIFQHMWNGLMKESERGVARVHPTQKPIALFAWLYEKYGSAGDLILDPFLGSGPSLKAAEDTDRTVIGFELSPAYIDHILEWGEARGLTVELLTNA